MVRAKVHKGEAYILRTCNAYMTSHGGFVWPKSGMVEAPDWKATAECGNGLHGFLWGEGDGSMADWSSEAVWIVAKVGEWSDLGGKVKFPRAEVVFCGSRLDATARIAELGARGAIVGGTASAGDGGTIHVRWWDGQASRYRTAVGYVGEDGIEAGIAYRVEDGCLVAVIAKTEGRS